ncbi:MAG: hypothetical protein LC737_02080 [Chloroflexi bacterium]|nr:hypothetical protein [Chloroflexota bacterium]
MNPEAGQAWFRIATFITLVSAALLIVQPRDSAEFVISVTTFVMGLLFMGAIVLLIRHGSR